jgi:riboflavin synthase alpha subunit
LGDITFGTVVSVDGTTLTVKTQDGKTVKVETTSDTKIQITEDGQVSDLAKGDSVVVNGATDDGTVKAETITEGSMALRGGPQTNTN